MTTYTAALDLEDALALPTACPSCGHEPLRPVADGDRSNLLCWSCGRCWHVEMNWTSRVDPHACGTCTQQEACLRLVDRPRE
ncbi:hypothetical protein [Actinomycetospora cinnamomea]|uniref:Uncharacterized protein n=1 Tax=Actinomycetospora cinnamomea TaxID=663609 RepID=A0A2U1F2B0_9PSEU|nr:hypothetical protein [Actinomycetospora cinnamomea]PVZ06325.1 hypothetical protein C8D89_11363 [Actinomycetospora cinnamomea]